MSALGFQERFVPAIEARSKKHSIRRTNSDGKLRFAVGKPIQLYRRARQKDMRKIVTVDPMCTKIEEIEIGSDYGGETWVEIDGAELSHTEIAALAKADGFADLDAFFAFFVPKEPQVFRGYIIHWDWAASPKEGKDNG